MAQLVEVLGENLAEKIDTPPTGSIFAASIKHMTPFMEKCKNTYLAVKVDMTIQMLIPAAAILTFNTHDNGRIPAKINLLIINLAKSNMKPV